jgi:hypothetical protein
MCVRLLWAWRRPLHHRDGAIAARAKLRTPGATSHYISSLPPGINYFALTSITAEGAESDYSALVSATGAAGT